MKLLPIAAFALAATLAAAAQAGGICGASGACDDQGSNVEYKDCLGKLAEQQDKKLNDLYRKVKALLQSYDSQDTGSDPLLPTFTAAQKNWLTFRDAQCVLEYGMAQGGTAGGGYESDCLCNLTYNRNADLLRMLASYGEQ
jgi:uncharacterized protein YecT (DUF1311 family)